jgi:hypothetical protein
MRLQRLIIDPDLLPEEKPAGATLTRKAIDSSPGWRYSSDQKKAYLNFLYVLRAELFSDEVTWAVFSPSSKKSLTTEVTP